MKKRRMFLTVFILLLLTGCRSTPFDGHTVIDWVDFIQLDGKEYNGIHSGVLADQQYIGEKMGTVGFRVAGNVTNPSYKLRNGDAAIHEKGTEIFSIKDHPHLIAVKDTNTINGYKVYFSREDTEYLWHFKDMPIDKVKRIEIYETNPPEGDQLISELTENEEVKSFLQLLINSEEKPDFWPNTERGDPLTYTMVFYTEGPLAYKYDMQFDGETYYWYPWDTSIVSNNMKRFVSGN